MERGKGKKDKGKEPEKGKEDKEKRKEAEKERTKDKEKEKGKGKDKRKGSQEDKRKGSQEDKRKGSQEDKRKGSQEDKRKGSQEDKRKGSQEDKRKGSQEEDKKKESKEENKKKESKKEEDKKKESKEEEESQEEDKRKESQEDKKKESQEEDKRQEKDLVKEEDRRVLGKPGLEPPPEKNNYILVLGLDGAGKTSVLYSLALNRVQHSEAPTQGFLEVCINTEHCQMEFLEIGGSEPFRSYWEMYVSRGMLLIFVVDSADHRRLPEAKKCLHRLIEINPCIPLVVFANKQDLKTAYHITDIHEALGLSDVGNDRTMFLFGTQVTENGSEIPCTMKDAKDLIAHLAAHRH